MHSSLVESLIGAAVLGVAILFAAFAYLTTDAGRVTGYEVEARFNRVDGIRVGSDVRMSGIKIGTVARLELDPGTFFAKARLSIREDVEIPDDSAAKIMTESVLGGAYVSIEPGGSETVLADGGELTITQGSVDLLGLVTRAMLGGPGTPNPAAEGPAP